MKFTNPNPSHRQNIVHFTDPALFQRKQRGSDDEVIEGMEALTAFCMVNGYVPDSSDSSPSPKNDSGYASAGSPKKSFAEMMEHAICRELVTAE
ncbi:hypothetical protein Y032_0110g174 [Ancylostoma ceylanicum]|nr:hypothetical protein Y032_0110g174 [Ancylostoma ceylanicum]